MSKEFHKFTEFFIWQELPANNVVMCVKRCKLYKFIIMKKILFGLTALISILGVISCDKNADKPAPDFSDKTVTKFKVTTTSLDITDNYTYTMVFAYDNEGHLSSVRQYNEGEPDVIQEFRYEYEPGFVTVTNGIIVKDDSDDGVTEDYRKLKMELDEEGRASILYISGRDNLDEPFGEYKEYESYQYDDSKRLVRENHLWSGFGGYTEYYWDGANITGDKYTGSEGNVEQRKFFYSKCLNNASIDLNCIIMPTSSEGNMLRFLDIFGTRTKNCLLPVDPDDEHGDYPTDPSACSVETDEDGNLVSITYSIGNKKTVMSVYYK